MVNPCARIGEITLRVTAKAKPTPNGALTQLLTFFLILRLGFRLGSRPRLSSAKNGDL
jgi:hypothetical protein